MALPTIDLSQHTAPLQPDANQKLPSIPADLLNPLHARSARKLPALRSPHSIPKPVLRPEIIDAIETIHADRLRSLLREICNHHKAARDMVECQLLVPIEMAVPYQDESAGEDSGDSSEEELEEEAAGEFAPKHPSVESKKRKLEAISVDSLRGAVRPRYAVCEHCDEEFDITCNERGICVWHPEGKEVDYESSFWDDHDDDCHGHKPDLADDETYEEGFVWTCCENSGSQEGCKRTMHLARDGTKRMKN